MEKTINKKNVENAQSMEQQILAYLNKCSRHLFTEYDKFYKVLPIKIDDKWYAIGLSFDNTKVSLKVIDVEKYVKIFGNNAKKVLKDELFYCFEGHSIKNFKRMKEKMVEVIKYIQKNYGNQTHQKLVEGLSKILNIEMKKSQ